MVIYGQLNDLSWGIAASAPGDDIAHTEAQVLILAARRAWRSVKVRGDGGRLLAEYPEGQCGEGAEEVEKSSSSNPPAA